MKQSVIIAIVVGGVLLALGIAAMVIFAFRGQQTGSQLTEVGVAEANKLKGTQVQTYVEGGGSAMPFLNR